MKKGKTLAVLCHVGGLFGSSFVPGLGGIILILIIWILGKSPDKLLLDQHAKEAINFHISILLYGIVISILTILVFSVGGVFLLSVDALGGMNDRIFDTVAMGAIGALSLGLVVQLFVLFVIGLVVLIAIVNAISGRDCHYPLTIRLIK